MLYKAIGQPSRAFRRKSIAPAIYINENGWEGAMRPHNHFGTFFLILALLALFTSSNDWLVDIGICAIIYAGLWVACNKWKQTNTTLTLLVLAPLPHLLGSFGLYNWSLGNLSYDIVVHISTTFLTILLVASITHKRSWQQTIMIVIGIILIGAAVVEVVEWTTNNYQGDGMFRRGPGDYCAIPRCTETVDTQKDLISNSVGLVLGLVAVLSAKVQRSAD